MKEGHINQVYVNIWWKLLFNAVWVGLVLFLTVASAVVSIALSSEFPLATIVTNVLWMWLAHAMIVPAVVLIIASGGLDLSTSAVVAFTGILIALLAAVLNLGVAVLIGMFVALLIGLVNGILVGATRIHGALVTLGMATLLRGISFAINQGKPVQVANVGLLSSPALFGFLLVFSIIVSVVLALLLARHRSGVRPDDDRSSWISRLFFVGTPYVLSGLMAGVVGAMYLGRLRVGLPTVGAGMEVNVILIALLGGTPLSSGPLSLGVVNIIGAILAAILFAVVQNIMSLMGSSPYLEVAKGVALLIVGLLSYVYWKLLNAGGKGRYGLAITSLLLGIFSLFTWSLPIGGLPISVIGLVCGFLGANSSRRAIAITGIAICIIGLIFTLVNALLGVYLVVRG